MRKPIVFLIALALVLDISAGQLQNDLSPEPPSPPDRKANGGAILAIGAGAAAAAGVLGLFAYRRAMRERYRADSVISLVERAWDSAGVLYATEQYRPAIMQLQTITGNWYVYERYSTRYRQRRRVDPDSIGAVIASCDFLESMIPAVRSLSDYAENLPLDDYSFTKMGRHECAKRKKYLRESMDSIMDLHANHRNGLQYSFRHIDRRLHLLDSLIEASYLQHKTDFDVKNRFYYNRAVESGDSGAIRRFIDDCDYYQVDREWCQRARMAVRGRSDGKESGPAEMRVRTAADSVEAEYRMTMQSKRVELLDAYIQKYSSRKYRPKRYLAKVDSVKIELKRLRQEIDDLVTFNKRHPRFGNAGERDLVPVIKGVAHTAGEAFGAAWPEARKELVKLPAIRLPASFTVDYTLQPPAFTLDAVVSPAHDIKPGEINGRTTFQVTCLVPVMRFLHNYKMRTVEMLRRRRTDDPGYNEVIEYQINKIRGAIYILRLRRPDGGGTVIFYGRENRETGADTGDGFQFYDFYDMAVTGYDNRRFPIYPGSLPNVIPSLSSDSLEQVMGSAFFGK